jgi:hypothetical protein
LLISTEPIDDSVEDLPLHAHRRPHTLSEIAVPSYSLRAAFVWAIIIRSSIFLIGVASVQLLPIVDLNYASGEPWIAFDSLYYQHLVTQGYPISHDSPIIAYFPLYPFISRLVASFVPAELALLIVSNFCTLVGCIFVYKWARMYASQRIAFFTTLLLMTMPAGIFLSAGLTEGPFMMMAAMCLWLIGRKQLFLAAIVCGFASLTRPTAAALAVVVALAALSEATRLGWFKHLLRTGLIGLISISGTVSYQAYLVYEHGRIDAYSAAQDQWDKDSDRAQARQSEEGVKRYSLQFFLDRAMTPQAWNRGIALVLVSVSLLGFFIRSPLPRYLFALPIIIALMGYLPNDGLRASAIHRYMLAALPTYLMIAYLLSPARRRALEYVTLLMCFSLQAYYATLYSRGVWVG